jgi:hypothetical protein
MTVAEITFLVGASEKLVRDYLAVYQQAEGQSQQMEKLAEELARVNGLNSAEKRGG